MPRTAKPKISPGLREAIEAVEEAQEAEAVAVIKSAERTRKRNELAAALLVDSREALTALPITDIGGGAPLSNLDKKW